MGNAILMSWTALDKVLMLNQIYSYTCYFICFYYCYEKFLVYSQSYISIQVEINIKCNIAKNHSFYCAEKKSP